MASTSHGSPSACAPPLPVALVLLVVGTPPVPGAVLVAPPVPIDPPPPVPGLLPDPPQPQRIAVPKEAAQKNEKPRMARDARRWRRGCKADRWGSNDARLLQDHSPRIRLSRSPTIFS
jgi:hypothetical protein